MSNHSENPPSSLLVQPSRNEQLSHGQQIDTISPPLKEMSRDHLRLRKSYLGNVSDKDPLTGETKKPDKKLNITSEQINIEARVFKDAENLICSISHELPIDPVIIQEDNGQVYERKEIMEWVKNRNEGGYDLTSPMTRKKFTEKDIVSAEDAQRKIIDFIQKYPESKITTMYRLNLELSNISWFKVYIHQLKEFRKLSLSRQRSGCIKYRLRDTALSATAGPCIPICSQLHLLNYVKAAENTAFFICLIQTLIKMLCYILI